MTDSSERVPVVAVASGKGGVGKTTVAVNLEAARDADEGRPVMITGAVPEQVASYQHIAGQVAARLTGS